MATEETIRQNRQNNGKFAKGNCANPGGRPKLPEELKQLCRAKAEEAINVAAELLNDTQQPGTVRLKAAEILLDRGYGKAPQALTGEDGAPIPIQLIEIIKPGGGDGGGNS